jgi:phytoene synthase
LPLLDAWEALTAPPPLDAAAVQTYADGRGAACASLARLLGRSGEADAAHRLGRIWALEDLAMRLGRADERETVLSILRLEPKALPRVGRPIRSLRVLAGLARRRRAGGSEHAAASPAAVVEALKLGLLGL